MSIRPATAQDISALETLARALPTAAHWTPAQYHELFTFPPRIVWLIEEANAIVAFLVARSSNFDWEIENLAVAEARQRRGLATELLRALIAHATASGATSIFLEVRASNLPAQRFYQAHTFREAGRRPSYYTSPSEDAIVLRRDLSI
jgi:[ribosomal protein S18]-alanine N-acetyltransferase